MVVGIAKKTLTRSIVMIPINNDVQLSNYITYRLLFLSMFVVEKLPG